MIGVIDYGMGNIGSILRMLKKLDVSARHIRSPNEMKLCSKLILPGVGAIDSAIEKLSKNGYLDELDKLVVDKKFPLLGICLGMQLLFDSSEEGKKQGMGWIPGVVKRFDSDLAPTKIKVPNMGWSDILAVRDHKILNSLGDDARFYFVHSYYAVPSYGEHVIAISEHGHRFCCITGYDNIIGVQFHPEKSHRYGMQLLNNFNAL